jgi:hypothetical protein
MSEPEDEVAFRQLVALRDLRVHEPEVVDDSVVRVEADRTDRSGGKEPILSHLAHQTPRDHLIVAVHPAVERPPALQDRGTLPKALLLGTLDRPWHPERQERSGSCCQRGDREGRTAAPTAELDPD